MRWHSVTSSPLGTVATLLLGLAPLVAADPPLLASSEDAVNYDNGKWGFFPYITTLTTNDIAPRLLRRTWDPTRCQKGGEYYFFAPHGFLIGHSGPTIFDKDGHQVWFGGAGHHKTYGFEVQKFRGENYLAWWSGDNSWRDHGKGNYYMYDKHYQLYRKISAVGQGMDGDLHDFMLTEDDTAIFTIYQTMQWDLSPWNVTGDKANITWINDSLFQEVDVDTNELLFEWRASDHISLWDCYGGPSDKGKNEVMAWDWFHINSVQKDRWGNYLISARYTHAIYYIEAKTGNVLWHLGGMHNNFTDLSDGRATNIARQHHARWHDDYKTITVFDNGVPGPHPDWHSRGLHIALDRSNPSHLTASLLAEAIHPHNYSTVSQGSVQKLPGRDGNLLVGWGNTGAWTEFSADGKEVLCDWQFAGLFMGANHSWSPGVAESYRAFRSDWHGYPLDNPAVVFNGHEARETSMLVSWNGATELRHWVLDGVYALGVEPENIPEDEWEHIGLVARQGFESNITFDKTLYEAFRLTALDADMQSLGMWLVNSTGFVVEKINEPTIIIIRETPWPLLILCGTISAIVAIFFYTCWLSWLSRRRRHQISHGYSSSVDSTGFVASAIHLPISSRRPHAFLTSLLGLGRKKSWYDGRGSDDMNGSRMGSSGNYKEWNGGGAQGADTVALMAGVGSSSSDDEEERSESGHGNVIARSTNRNGILASAVDVDDDGLRDRDAEVEIGRRNSWAPRDADR